ncbi:MAG: hypothetical protein LBD90_00435 [Bifidobacteriaceae bacterium]|jgi:hypothetical protein|nr:hypothetical protein [Bifidobacteriaceae bacterium]
MAVSANGGGRPALPRPKAGWLVAGLAAAALAGAGAVAAATLPSPAPLPSQPGASRASQPNDPGQNSAAPSPEPDRVEQTEQPAPRDATDPLYHYTDGSFFIWEAEAAWGDFAVSRDMVVVASPLEGAASLMEGFKRSNGDRQWSRTLPDAPALTCENTNREDRMVCLAGDQERQGFLIDPRTGEDLDIAVGSGWTGAQPDSVTAVTEINSGYLATFTRGGTAEAPANWGIALSDGFGQSRWRVVLPRAAWASGVGEGWIERDGIVSGGIDGVALDLGSGSNLLADLPDCANPTVHAGRHIWCDWPGRSGSQIVEATGADFATVHFTAAQLAFDGAYPDGIVIAATDQPGVYDVLDAATGALLWAAPEQFAQIDGVVWNGAFLAATYTAEGQVSMVALGTGEVTASAPQAVDRELFPPDEVLFADLFTFAVVMTSPDHRVRFFDAFTAEPFSHYQADALALGDATGLGGPHILRGSGGPAGHDPSIPAKIRYVAPTIE